MQLPSCERLAGLTRVRLAPRASGCKSVGSTLDRGPGIRGRPVSDACVAGASSIELPDPIAAALKGTYASRSAAFCRRLRLENPCDKAAPVYNTNDDREYRKIAYARACLSIVAPTQILGQKGDRDFQRLTNLQIRTRLEPKQSMSADTVTHECTQ